MKGDHTKSRPHNACSLPLTNIQFSQSRSHETCWLSRPRTWDISWAAGGAYLESDRCIESRVNMVNPQLLCNFCQVLYLGLYLQERMRKSKTKEPKAAGALTRVKGMGCTSGTSSHELMCLTSVSHPGHQDTVPTLDTWTHVMQLPFRSAIQHSIS
jgi:hypothetical protein